MTGPITVAMLNRKGGCGKTSTCHHLAGAFAKDGRRVLLVDMDPQASLTQGLFGPQATEDMPARSTVVGLFDDAYDPDPEALIRPTPFERIAIVPGSNALDDFNVPRPQEAGEIQLSLRRFLKEARDGFDVALIDCPPNLSLCSWSALLAADFVVVPVQAEDYGAQGIVYIQRAFDLALAHHNPRLRLARLPGHHVQQVAWASTPRTTTSCGRSTATRSSSRDGPPRQGLQGGRRGPTAGVGSYKPRSAASQGRQGGRRRAARAGRGGGRPGRPSSCTWGTASGRRTWRSRRASTWTPSPPGR